MITHCPVCRYLLVGLPTYGHCPECGFSYDKLAVRYATTAPRAIVIGVMMVSAVVSVGAILSITRGDWSLSLLCISILLVVLDMAYRARSAGQFVVLVSSNELCIIRGHEVIMRIQLADVGGIKVDRSRNWIQVDLLQGRHEIIELPFFSFATAEEWTEHVRRNIRYRDASPAAPPSDAS